MVTIPTVSLTRTFSVDGRTVGYLMFRNFVQPSYAALDDAFAALKDAGITELVIDLRYNGGGLVDVATHLAGLVGGPVTDGRVFGEFRHNDKNSRLNDTLRFTNPPQTLTLARLGSPVSSTSDPKRVRPSRCGEPASASMRCHSLSEPRGTE